MKMNFSLLYNKLNLMLLCCILSAVTGTVRYLTSPEYALSLFYLFPIILSSWYISKPAGIFFSFLSALTWLYADLQVPGSFSSIFIPYINELFRLIVFIILALMVSNLRKAMDHHKTIARTDFLTDIPNRLAFFEYAEVEMHKSRRLRRSMTIIYIDIDNFKTVNDTYGHKAGDTLLIKVAGTIKTTIRSIDIAARLGGDEFAVFIWRSSPAIAKAVAKKLKDNLSALVKTDEPAVTFSIGVATYETVPDKFSDMVKQCDELMYLAKKNGKDCIKYKLFTN